MNVTKTKKAYNSPSVRKENYEQDVIMASAMVVEDTLIDYESVKDFSA